VEIVRIAPGRAAGLAGPAVTVGNFDGVHRGHQALLSAAVARAGEDGRPVVVLAFEPHPARVLQPERAPASLMTVGQKAETLAELGASALALLPFTAQTAKAPPDAFAREVLAQALGARHVVVGEGFRFGANRGGGVGDLVRLGRELGFEVLAVPALFSGGTPISSSRIRQRLAEGDVAGAAELLGRGYFVDGSVVRGDGRGRTLGIPTANVAPENEVLPAAGVYACRVRTPQGPGAPAVANLGHRPTFGGTSPRLEVHLLDFDADLYGQQIRVTFVERLREERAFGSAGALVKQIEEDVKEARTRLCPAPGEGRGAEV
jgi:riboflavin kinase/FMN adenylyltransferase